MIKASLRQLCMLSIFCGAVLSVSPEGGVKRLMNILVTAVLMLAVITPLKDMDYEFYALELAKLRENEAALSGKAEDLSKRINRLCIEDEYKAYIMDKAAALGTELKNLKLGLKWSSEGLWVPESLESEYAGSIADIEKLSGILSGELGIPAENQIWRQYEGA